jgi:hypothetical protein
MSAIPVKPSVSGSPPVFAGEYGLVVGVVAGVGEEEGVAADEVAGFKGAVVGGLLVPLPLLPPPNGSRAWPELAGKSSPPVAVAGVELVGIGLTCGGGKSSTAGTAALATAADPLASNSPASAAVAKLAECFMIPASVDSVVFLRAVKCWRYSSNQAQASSRSVKYLDSLAYSGWATSAMSRS